MKTIEVNLSGIKIPKAKILDKPIKTNGFLNIEGMIRHMNFSRSIKCASREIYKESYHSFWDEDCIALDECWLFGVYNEQGARLVIYYMEKLAENGKDYAFFLDNIIWMVKRTEVFKNPDLIVKMSLEMGSEKCKA